MLCASDGANLVFGGRAGDEIEAELVEDVGALEEVAVAGGGDQAELGAADPRHDLPGEARRDEDVVFGDADEKSAI